VRSFGDELAVAHGERIEPAKLAACVARQDSLRDEPDA